MNHQNENGMLKAKFHVWLQNDPELVAAMKVSPDDLPRSTLIKLLFDNDRRLAQIQDKVTFERKHGLVNYSSVSIKDKK